MATAVVATDYGGPEVLTLVKETICPPRRDEVAIRVKAAGVNPIDYKIYSGLLGNDPPPAQLAIMRGARVIGTASQTRHDALRRYGIAPVAYGPGLLERVCQLAPVGIDAAIDTVGTDEAIEVSLELAADPSRIATIVAFHQDAGAGIKKLGGAPGATDRGTEIRSQAWSELIPLAAAGRLGVVVARTFPLAETAAAHELVAGGHAGGKVVLVP